MQGGPAWHSVRTYEGWDELGGGSLNWAKVKLLSRVQLFCDHMVTRLLRPQDFLGKSTGAGCHFILQGINPGPLHCRQTLYRLSHTGFFWGYI